MKKNEMLKELKDLVALVENQELFSEKYELTDGQYYPFSQGYLLTMLENIIDRASNNN